MTISEFTDLLGWVSAINIAYLLLATMSVTCLRKRISSIHSKMFGIDQTALVDMYFGFLSNYKVVTLAFFVAPYIALKCMGQ